MFSSRNIRYAACTGLSSSNVLLPLAVELKQVDVEVGSIVQPVIHRKTFISTCKSF